VIIDVHSHLFAPEYLDRIAKNGGTLPELSAAPLHSLTISERIDLMDSQNVDLQVLSVGTLQPYAADRRVASDLARFANDSYVKTCLDWQPRFAVFAALPLPDIDAAVAEIDRVANERSVVGVALNSSVLGRQLDDPSLLPLYEVLDERAATVFIHPAMAYDGFGQDDHGMNRSVGGMFEDTIVTLRLLFSGICARHPRIKFIVPHLGGTLPFVYGRVRRHIERYEREWRESGMPGSGGPAADQAAREGLRRFWFDTAMRHAPALSCACETVGHSNLVFGTDYPYLKTMEELDVRIRNIRDLPIPAEARDAILGGTAAALLGIGPATTRANGKGQLP
jgi:6-methylsalicylate decarboxylase